MEVKGELKNVHWDLLVRRKGEGQILIKSGNTVYYKGVNENAH